MKRNIQIKESIGTDGVGIPTISIYMTLCDKKELTGSFCENCQNKELQENNIGYRLELEDAIKFIEEKINNFKKMFGKCELALLGGEPLSKTNREYSYELAKYFSSIGIDIILYTWRTPKQIKKENQKYSQMKAL
jgi:hypothetical protein